MSTVIDTPQTKDTVVTYASFGARFVAMIIDYIIIGVLQGVVITPILAVMGLGIASQAQGNDLENLSDAEAIGLVGTMMAGIGTTLIVVWSISLLYFAILESSKSQASVGKMALGIKVTDVNGDRLNFGKALLRSVGKVISGMIMYIGYIMAAFTEKKQGLHDMIANTIVVKK
jgi:uncharacterized RDD family membrane protein YckC